MKTVKILAHPRLSLFSELFPFYRWKNHLKDDGIKIEVIDKINDPKLRGSDILIIQSKYFSRGWQNIDTRTEKNEEEVINHLKELKKATNKLIWFDQSASTGCFDFPIIRYVDRLIVKQMLKDSDYYINPNGNKNSRVWLNPEMQAECQNFIPCPKDQFHKIRLGWNTGYNDYRMFKWKFKELSNFIPNHFYPLKISRVKKNRPLDLAYRGRLKYDCKNLLGIQRNKVLMMLDNLNEKYKISKGKKVSRGNYLSELRKSKISISPFGYGEVCYRDFESFISGAVLIKPSMDHMLTFPDVYKPHQTYIPVSWDMSDLQETFEKVRNNYHDYIEIAENGQKTYLNTVNNPECFTNALRRIIN